MMRTCAACEQWAQWRALNPDKTIELLCGTHKEMRQKADELFGVKNEGHEPIKFTFIGSAPGIPCS